MVSGIHAYAAAVPRGRRSPDEYLDNFAADLGTRPGLIQFTTQIKSRSVAPAFTLPSDLAIEAGRDALAEFEARGNDPATIDAVYFCGMRPDSIEPNTAHTVAAALGLSPSIVIGINDACNGFGAGMVQAESEIISGRTRFALVVTGEMGSSHEVPTILALRTTNRPARKKVRDWGATFTLGDAGGAVILGPAEHAQIRLSRLTPMADSRAHMMCRIRDTNAPLEVDQSELKLKVRDLVWPSFYDYRHSCCVPKDAYYIVHQTSPRVLKEMRELVGIPSEQFADTVTHYGNLISATFPVQLQELRPRLRRDDAIVAMLAGSGVSATFMYMQVTESPAVSAGIEDDERTSGITRTAVHGVPLEPAD